MVKHTARSIPLAALAGLLFFLSPILSGSLLGAQDPDAGTWRHLVRIEELLLDEEYAQAREESMMFASTLVELARPGRTGEILLGRNTLLRALAEAGLENDEEADWYYHVAKGIDPMLRDFDLDRFGEPGDVLREVEIRSTHEATEAELNPPPDRVTRPRKIHHPLPKWPPGARAAKATGTLVVQLVIDETGRTRRPTVDTPLPTATLTWVALEAVKTWRFEPAREDGEPASVYYNLTINYQLTNRCDPEKETEVVLPPGWPNHLDSRP